MRETGLRWFGHIKWRSEDAHVGQCEMINLWECKRGRGRPKKSWNKVIKHDLKSLQLMEDMIRIEVCGGLGLISWTINS